MKDFSPQRIWSWSLAALLVFAWQLPAHADPIVVHAPQASFHGFLEVRSQDGHVVAFGDVTQAVHGDRITSETVFHFKDGSVDDEVTVFTQHGTFQLISDHHVQRGHVFPHPTDVLIDARTGMVTVHSMGRDGKDEVKTSHVNLPPDLANGLVPLAVENMLSSTPVKTISMLLMIPTPRVVRLVITNVGEDNCSVVGVSRKATHYESKIELGGMVGMVAPLIGKAPPIIQMWAIGGQTTTFAREQGPLYPDGPIMTIQLVSPTWP